MNSDRQMVDALKAMARELRTIRQELQRLRRDVRALSGKTGETLSAAPDDAEKDGAE